MNARIITRQITAVMLLIALSVVHPASRALANPPSMFPDDLRPLAELPGVDGRLRLNAGFRGALNPSDWRMEEGVDMASTVVPVATSASVNAWHPLGSGLNNVVTAIAVAGSDVYVGGTFTDAGGNPNADRIARWGALQRVCLPLVLKQ